MSSPRDVTPPLTPRRSLPPPLTPRRLQPPPLTPRRSLLPPLTPLRLDHGDGRRTPASTPRRTPASTPRRPESQYGRAARERTPRRRVVQETRRVTPGSVLRVLSRVIRRDREEVPQMGELRPAPVPGAARERVASEPGHARDLDLPPELDLPDVEDFADSPQRGVSRVSLPSLMSELSDIAVPEGLLGDFASEFEHIPSEFPSEFPDALDALGGEESHDLDADPFREQTGESARPTGTRRPVSRRIGPSAPPALSTSSIRHISNVLLRPPRPLGRTAITTLARLSDTFFSQQMADLEAYAEHAGRKTIDMLDMRLMLRRRRVDTGGGMLAVAHNHLPVEDVQRVEKWVTKRRRKG